MSDKPATSIAEKLRALRRKQGLSQQDVAHRLGISRQTISNWEAGQSTPGLDKAAQLAALYRVSLDELACTDIAIWTCPDPRCERACDLHLLESLAGARCKLCLLDYALAMRIGDRPVTVLAVNRDWIRVSHKPSKHKPATVELIDLDVIMSFELLEE